MQEPIVALRESGVGAALDAAEAREPLYLHTHNDRPQYNELLSRLARKRAQSASTCTAGRVQRAQRLNTCVGELSSAHLGSAAAVVL